MLLSASVEQHGPSLPLQNYQYSWCVDPLDGTKEFLKRNGQFTVNIALLQRGRPVLGVVQVPVQGLVYFAVKASGAWRRAAGADTRLQCAPFAAGQAGLTVVGSASHMTLETTEFLKDYVDPKFEQLGSSLKLLLVRAGAARGAAWPCSWLSVVTPWHLNKGMDRQLGAAATPATPRSCMLSGMQLNGRCNPPSTKPRDRWLRARHMYTHGWRPPVNGTRPQQIS